MSRPDKPEELADYPVVITLPIQWGDQDAFGHVNNTVVIRRFESARVAYLDQSGLGHLMSGSRLGPMLASITCNYRRQLRYPDAVHISARVSRLGRTSIIMDHAVYSQQGGAIDADGQSVFVMFDYDASRPTRVPNDVREAIEKLEGKSFSEGSGP